MRLLTLKNVSRSYPISKYKQFYALKNINLSFDDYGLTSIVGKSGSGKTTLINIITKIDYPTEGEIIFAKRKYKKKDYKSYKFYRNDIGVVFQQFDLLDDCSVIYNVALPLLIKGYKTAKAYTRAKSLLEYVFYDENSKH